VVAAPPAPAPDATAPAAGPRPMYVKPGLEDSALAVDALGAFRVGARVRLKKRDRALDPEESGHSARVAYGPGQEGEIVRFVHRRIPKLSAEFDVAVVRWDAQTWYEWDIPLNRMQEGKVYTGSDIDAMNQEKGKPVQLASFEAAAHPETLEWTGGTPKADVPAKKPDLGKPSRSHCDKPLRPVPNSYIIFVRDAEQTETIANDLEKTLKLKIKRVWPALSSFSAEMTKAQLERVVTDERLRDVQDNCK
jgi:hypothetical protein